MSTLNNLARSPGARATDTIHGNKKHRNAMRADAMHADAMHADAMHAAAVHAAAPLPSAPPALPLPPLPPVPATAAPTVIRRPRWSVMLTAVIAGCALWFLQPRRALAGPRSTPAATAPSPAPATTPDTDDTTTRAGKKAPTGKLNLNTAGVDQLMLLPGVGPSKAERIVAFRGKHGPFKRIADLRRVKGFGYKTLKKLEPFLDIKGETTLSAPP